MNISEHFKDLKKGRLPDPKLDQRDFEQLQDWEWRKCEEGVWIITSHGTRIRYSGWLYFHLNHFHIYQDYKLASGKKVRKLELPKLRDTELILNDAFIEAEYQQKGLMFFGSRRLGKSSDEASIITHGAHIWEGTENVIVGSNTKDIKVLTGYCSVASENMWEGLKLPHVSKDWNDQVIFGIKSKQNAPIEFSKILIRNTVDGTNTEALAGITPSTFVIDESGKSEFLSALAGAIPSFNDENGGWRCVPLVCGTSGDFEKPRDSKLLFDDPDNYNFLACTVPSENKQKGLFLSGLYRFDLKKDGTIEDFLENEKDRNLFLREPNIELVTIKDDPIVKIADKPKGKIKLEEELEKAKKSKNADAYLKAKMYHPLISDDCFLTKTENPFAQFAHELMAHRDYLYENDETQWVNLYKNKEGKIIHKFADLNIQRPITKFPHEIETTVLDQAIQVWDFPKAGGKYRMEVAGLDPYNIAKASDSSSLGAMYVIRRSNNDLQDNFQETMVCAYVARPDNMKVFLDNVQLILEWYNIQLLHENSNDIVLQHFDNQFKGHYLLDTWQLAKEINPNTRSKSTKGLSPSSTKNQEYIINNTLAYLGEEIQMGDLLVKGLYRIKDPLLIEELLQYGSVNTDRVWGFGFAVTHLNFTKKEGNALVIEEYDEKEKHQVVIQHKFPQVSKQPFPQLNRNKAGFRKYQY